MDIGRHEGDQRGNVAGKGLPRMVLDPLAEVRVGMFVAVVVGRGQLMVHFERGRKWRQRQEQGHQGQSQAPAYRKTSRSGH